MRAIDPLQLTGRMLEWVETGRSPIYSPGMLKAAFFERFKGATTLLLWGNAEDTGLLFAGFSALRDNRAEFAVDGLIVRYAPDKSKGSTLLEETNGLCWRCSDEIAQLAADLVEPLLHRAGHQFLDVDGLAEQVIISCDEYPADLR